MPTLAPSLRAPERPRHSALAPPRRGRAALLACVVAALAAPGLAGCASSAPPRDTPSDASDAGRATLAHDAANEAPTDAREPSADAPASAPSDAGPVPTVDGDVPAPT